MNASNVLKVKPDYSRLKKRLRNDPAWQEFIAKIEMIFKTVPAGKPVP